jgi:hypothetical protein
MLPETAFVPMLVVITLGFICAAFDAMGGRK